MVPFSIDPDKVILGIESSCDDTSAAVLRGQTLLSNVIASQKVHEQYGGVVPELASRAHLQNVVPVISEAIRQAGITREDIDVIAYTRGPGLLGSLLVGGAFAKGMSQALGIPMVDVNHLQGHVMAHFVQQPGEERPVPHYYPEDWCNVSMNYQSGEWLDYVVDRQQLLLSDEVDDLQSALSRFLNDEFMNAAVLGFAEPDIEFILYPKRDVRDDPNLLYISPEADPIQDIIMDLRVSFWNGGLTANYLSLCMDREDIEMLHKYLMLVTEKIDVDSEDIQKMISRRYLFI